MDAPSRLHRIWQCFPTRKNCLKFKILQKGFEEEAWPPIQDKEIQESRTWKSMEFQGIMSMEIHDMEIQESRTWKSMGIQDVEIHGIQDMEIHGDPGHGNPGHGNP
ncbi:hypothetical protein HGM15179_017797 [Zosterops borbonicus]|uniref:Uncharacterized protein n=1 Tax=Zosterops borbonicus TaxID=364589 RepID=A0A8K1LCY9_9PASS|nr:hypothetical protein HGM15179_017797 [Zosterops borbonicus]